MQVFLTILSLVGGSSVQGSSLGDCVTLGWPFNLTTLCLFPHGSSGRMLEPSLLQGCGEAGWNEVCKVLRCVRSEAMTAAHGCHCLWRRFGLRKAHFQPHVKSSLFGAVPAHTDTSGQLRRPLAQGPSNQLHH